MAANISYANIAKKAAGTSEDNDESQNPDTVQVQAAKTTENNESEISNDKKPKKVKRRNRREKKAAKIAAEAAEKAKSNESSEAEAEVKVFIPAPPPKVNVWLKKSAENTVTEEDETEDNTEKAKKEPTPADAAVMKESTAENRPPAVVTVSKPNKPLVSSALGSPWKTTQVNTVQVRY